MMLPKIRRCRFDHFNFDAFAQKPQKLRDDAVTPNANKPLGLSGVFVLNVAAEQIRHFVGAYKRSNHVLIGNANNRLRAGPAVLFPESIELQRLGQFITS